MAAERSGGEGSGEIVFPDRIYMPPQQPATDSLAGMQPAKTFFALTEGPAAPPREDVGEPTQAYNPYDGTPRATVASTGRSIDNMRQYLSETSTEGEPTELIPDGGYGFAMKGHGGDVDESYEETDRGDEGPFGGFPETDDSRERRGGKLAVFAGVVAVAVIAGGVAAAHNKFGGDDTPKPSYINAPKPTQTRQHVSPDTPKPKKGDKLFGNLSDDPSMHAAKKQRSTEPSPEITTKHKHNSNKPKPQRTTTPAAPKHTHRAHPAPAPTTHESTTQPEPSPSSTASPTPTESPTTTTPTESTSPTPTESNPSPETNVLPSAMLTIVEQSVDNDKRRELTEDDEGLAAFLDQDNIKQTVKLWSLDSGAIDAYRAESDEIYSDPDVSAELGGAPQAYDLEALQNGLVASSMVANTDTVLKEAANALDTDPGLRVIDLAYLDKKLQNEYRHDVEDGTQYDDAQETALLDAGTFTLKDESNINLVATWSRYGEDENGDAIEKVRWSMPVQVGDGYVNVTLAEMPVDTSEQDDGWWLWGDDDPTEKPTPSWTPTQPDHRETPPPEPQTTYYGTDDHEESSSEDSQGGHGDDSHNFWKGPDWLTQGKRVGQEIEEHAQQINPPHVPHHWKN